MKIRPPASTDRDAIEALLRSDHTFRADEVEVALELVDETIAGSDDYRIRVAELPGGTDSPNRTPGGVGGYICYGPTPMTAGTHDLYWIVTHRACRGLGVASALVRAMEDDLYARGGTAVRVETSSLETYAPAHRLYARLGYPEVARLEDFYRPGDSLVLYFKRL